MVGRGGRALVSNEHPACVCYPVHCTCVRGTEGQIVLVAVFAVVLPVPGVEALVAFAVRLLAEPLVAVPARVRLAGVGPLVHLPHPSDRPRCRHRGGEGMALVRAVYDSSPDRGAGPDRTRRRD